MRFICTRYCTARPQGGLIACVAALVVSAAFLPAAVAASGVPIAPQGPVPPSSQAQWRDGVSSAFAMIAADLAASTEVDDEIAAGFDSYLDLSPIESACEVVGVACRCLSWKGIPRSGDSYRSACIRLQP